MLSVGFVNMSCSPDEELTTEEEQNGPRQTYSKVFFMMTGTYYYDEQINPKYDIIKAWFYYDTDEFVQVEKVLKSHEELMIQASEKGWDSYGFVSTRVFVEYNITYYESDSSIPLMINPDYETTEFQLDLHLSENIQSGVDVPGNGGDLYRSMFANRIELFRNMDLVFYQ